METKNYNSLPVILISAENEAIALSLISEIIDNIPEDTYNNGDFQTSTDNVWRLVNKYYTADVRLHPLGDQQELDPNVKDLIEAHVIYLSPDEVACPTSSERLLEQRAAVAGGASVRVLAVAGRHEPPALLRAAALARYELVALAAAHDHAGLPRLRDALHAHVWPALRAASDSVSGGDSDSDGGSDSDGSWTSWRGALPAAADAVDGAELFAAALGSLPAAAEAARRTEPRGERLARAEQVLAAFCRALGEPVD